jgi:pyruvate/2-oxoglutarate dehydrogenase complex dihydrolipoamide acyltransferase (E2) component
VCAEDDDEDAPDLQKVQPTSAGNVTNVPKPSFPKTINTPKAAEKAVAKAVSEKPTDFPFGKNANVATVGGATQGGNPEITDEDIPNFDTPIQSQEPLSPEAEAAAQAMDAPEPLDQKRYNEIQERLKEIATNKLGGVTTKSLSAFLEARHKGKKLVYVPAVTAENTLKLVEEAVEGGPAKVKELFNSVKEKA